MHFSAHRGRAQQRFPAWSLFTRPFTEPSSSDILRFCGFSNFYLSIYLFCILQPKCLICLSSVVVSGCKTPLEEKPQQEGRGLTAQDRHAWFHSCADPHRLLLFILFWGKCLGVNSRFLKLICFRGILFKSKWTILNFGMIPYTFYEIENKWLVIWKHFSMKLSAFYANQSY